MPLRRGVILDVDGTLVDSNDAHARAWVEALRQAGFEVPYGRVRRLIGMGGDKLLPELTGLADDDPRGKAISEARGRIFQAQHLPHLRAFPGARELLVRMRQAGLRLAVASSAKEEELGPLLDLVGARELVEAETSKDDVAASKPDPDVVHAALGKLGLRPAEVVMLGDTPYDVEACARAGVAMIGFTCGGWSAHDLAGCVAIYEGPAALLEAFGRSPIAA
jgi:HAD superfamily hydrolase (TIGR01509 family)